MATCQNVSFLEPIVCKFYQYLPVPNDDPTKGWIETLVEPGQTITTPSRNDGKRECLSFYLRGPNGEFEGQLFWSGKLRKDDVVQVDPNTFQVRYVHLALTHDDLSKAKALFSDDAAVNAVSLDDLLNHAKGKMHGGVGAPVIPSTETVARNLLTPCQWATAALLLDIVCTFMGGVALSRTVNNAATLARIGRLVEGQEQAIRVIVANWSRAETTNFQRAEAAFKVLQLLYRVGQIDGILRVILGNLTLMDKILYASLALSEIAALVATDGGAMVVIVGLQFATNAAFMAVDASQVNQACAPTP